MSFRFTRSMLCWIHASIKLFITSFSEVGVGLPCGFLTELIAIE